MKISSKFKVRSIAGENVIIKQGKFGADMTKIISLNETSLFLWNKFQGEEFTSENVARALLEEYEVDAERAAEDERNWCDKLVECGLTE